MITLTMGLNDKRTLRQKIGLNRAMKQIGKMLQKNGLGYTLTSASGGYVHDNGMYVREKSIKIDLFTSKQNALNIANQLKVKYNQESIMFEERETVADYV